MFSLQAPPAENNYVECSDLGKISCNKDQECSANEQEDEIEASESFITNTPHLEDYQKTFNALARIRYITNGSLPIPCIIVVGDQSSGKSSLLTSISGIKFPEASGICRFSLLLFELKRDLSKWQGHR